jgi:hypothetical protein
MAYDNAPKKKFAEDYIDVAERLRAWYEAYPNGRIETSILAHTDNRVTVKALAYRGDLANVDPKDRPYHYEERPAGIGHSSMAIPGSTPYTRGSELENCETSAVGRALVMAGLPSKKVASGDEIRSKSGAAPKADPVVAAAKAIFEDDPALNDWRDAITGCVSAGDLAKVAQEIAASSLDADQKRWLGQFYTARKSELGA